MFKSLAVMALALSPHLTFAQQTPCADLQTTRDPMYIYMEESRGKPYDGAAFEAAQRRQLADGQRCRNRQVVSDAQLFLNALERSRAPKPPAPVIPSAPSIPSVVIEPQGSVVKELTVECEYGKKRPYEIFQLNGVEYQNGQVIAEGYHGVAAVKLTFNNKIPSQGRTLDVTIGSNTFSKSLSSNLNPIDYNSGLISRMAAGITDIKVKCYPLRQVVTSTAAQDNSSRGQVDRPTSGTSDAETDASQLAQ